MSNTSLFLVIFLVLLLVAVLKFAWSRSMARSQPPRRNDDLDDWDAVQHDRDNHDGGWDSSLRGYSLPWLLVPRRLDPWRLVP